MTNIWIVILIAATLSFAIRVLPAFLMKLAIEKYQNLIIFLDYAACSTIGSMIYLSAFSKAAKNILVTTGISTLFIINVVILAVSFILSLTMRNPVKTFIISILIYAAMLFFIPAH